MAIRRNLAGGRGAALIAFALFVSPPATADDAAGHFVSIRAGEVNLRTGPGRRYPVDWVFIRRGLPVEVIARHENWRQIRAKDGTIGWVHQSMLSGRRTVVIDGAPTTLHRKPRADAPVVARAEVDVIGELLQCERGWCRVDVSGLRGWVPKAGLWGVSPTDGR